MTNGQAFFQIAAGLLPTLLFGGVIAERLQAGRSSRGCAALSEPKQIVMAVVALVLVAFFLYAEITAIGAAIAGPRSRFDTGTVVGAVTLATLLIGLAVLTPWLSTIEPTDMRCTAFVGSALVLATVCILGRRGDPYGGNCGLGFRCQA